MGGRTERGGAPLRVGSVSATFSCVPLTPNLQQQLLINTAARSDWNGCIET